MRKLRPNCSKAQIDKLLIFYYNDPSKEDIRLYEQIPPQFWAGSLYDCGLREGYLLYFSAVAGNSWMRQMHNKAHAPEGGLHSRREMSPVAFHNSANPGAGQGMPRKPDINLSTPPKLIHQDPMGSGGPVSGVQ